MKKLKHYTILTISIVLLSIDSSRSQIIFEKEVDSLDLDIQFKVVNISDNESKYFFADTINNTFSLYNMDFTPFLLNVNVPEPFNNANYSYHVLYITRTLFDCDSTNIEYVYTAPLDADKPFRVLRTDGTLLFFRDSINSTYCFGCRGGSEEIRPIINTSSGAKLFLQTFRNGYAQTFIYGLCGNLPLKTVDNFEKVNELPLLRVFPNPTNSELIFETMPNEYFDYADFLITIFDQKLSIKSKFIIKNQENVRLNIFDFASGIYTYSIMRNKNIIQTGSFIVNH